jgi:hypothetical protein
LGKTFLLDRNVVTLLKHKNSTNNNLDKNHRRMLNFLKKNDLSENIFSPILSITEGQTGSIQNAEDFLQVAKREGAAVRNFFKNARTDADIWENEEYLKNIASTALREVNLEKYEMYLNRNSPKICQSPPRDKLDELKSEIILNAIESGINLSHPVIILCLSVLYGNPWAKRILKMTNGGINVYSALSDIMILSRVNQYISAGLSGEIEILTLDKGVNNFFSYFRFPENFRHISNTVDGDVFISTTYTIDSSVFERATEETRTELMQTLWSYSSQNVL